MATGASAAAVNKLASDKIMEIAKGDPAMAQWLSAAVGAVVSEINNKSALLGAAIVINATKNNLLAEELEFGEKGAVILVDGNFYIRGTGINGSDEYISNIEPGTLFYDENGTLWIVGENKEHIYVQWEEKQIVAGGLDLPVTIRVATDGQGNDILVNGEPVINADDIQKYYSALQTSQYYELAAEGKKDLIIATIGVDQTVKIPIVDNKIAGKIPVQEFIAIRKESMKNPTSDTLTLGSFEKGAGSYTVRAGNTTYFDLGDNWGRIENKYNLTNNDMFEIFNKPALEEAVAAGKTIRFSHNPSIVEPDRALAKEWNYLQTHFGYSKLEYRGGFWYAEK